ncbi:DOMON-like domain-containing protein [bacterium]|nr:DOMON-like domain-containing protein [bacterium]
MPPARTLVDHASTPLPAVTVAADALRVGRGLLRFDWTVEGPLEALLLPDPCEPRAADDLWRHTCLEAFVRPAGARAYVELNLSPSRAFAVYRFRAYRERDDAAGRPSAPTRIEARREGARLVLSARLDVAAVLGDPEAASGPLDVGLSAVVETADGRVAYFALRHPEGKPDFHHDDAFALRLEA